MKSPFVRFSRMVRSPLAVATAGISCLSGCQLFSGSHGGHARQTVAYYHAPQSDVGAIPASPQNAYEESLPFHIEPSAPLDKSPVPVEKPAKPLTPPLPEPTDVSTKTSTEPKSSEPVQPKVEPEPKSKTTTDPTEPAAEKPVTSEKQAQPKKSISPKKKPVKKPAKKPAKKKGDQESAVEAEEEVIDYFVPENSGDDSKADQSSEPDDSQDLPSQATSKSLEQTNLQVPPEANQSHDSAPMPKDSSTEISVVPPAADSQPMLIKSQSGEPKTLITVNPNAEKSSVPLTVSSTKTDASSSATNDENDILTLDTYCDHLVFDRQGFGYVTHRKQIVRFSPTGETTSWGSLANPKGHRIEPEGTHLVCDADRRAVLRLSFDGKVIGTAAKECDGTPLRSPYDLALDGRGGFYFTDPGFLQMESPVGKLHHVDRTGKVTLLASKLSYPTTVAFDPVFNRVLVVESQTGRVLEMPLAEPNRIETHRVLAELPKVKSKLSLASLCIDSEGLLYVSHSQSRKLQLIDPQGRLVGELSTGQIAPNGIALRSPDANEIFITGESVAQARRGKVIRLALGQ